MVRNITPSMDKVWKLKVDRFMKLPSSLPPSPSPPPLLSRWVSLGWGVWTVAVAAAGRKNNVGKRIYMRTIE